ncbi:hypothetical protein [Paenibacillus sp. TH7-28]
MRAEITVKSVAISREIAFFNGLREFYGVIFEANREITAFKDAAEEIRTFNSSISRGLAKTVK